MKAGSPETGGASAFLAKEARLVAFAREHARQAARPEAERVDSSRQLILAPGARVAGRYEVGPIFAVGGMGVVYKARHIELGQLVALKVLRPDMARNGAIWRRFSREARALSALHNKHVVRVHDAGTLRSGLRYVVMELLTGCTLRALLQETGALRAPQAVDYAIQVCSALGDAHRAHIVHRDIRPEHVFLANYAASDPCVKLIDFGMALFLDDAGQNTLTGRSPVSPDYVSPEQLRDPRQVDARSDLWSVGMLLYEMLTGGTPWRDLNRAQIALHIARGAVPPITHALPGLAPRLAATILRCLDVDPGRRPQSADDLCRLLEPFSSRHWPG